MTEYLSLAVTLASVLGGIELLKTFVHWRTNRQKESISVTDANMDVFGKQTDIMQERINYLDGVVKERNTKLDQVYRDLRESEEKRIEQGERISRLTLALERAGYWKCLVCKCSRRKPPQLEMEAETETQEEAL
jgi:hypothetical protein